MIYLMKMAFIGFLLMICIHTSAQIQGHNRAIYSGVPWFDDKGNVVSAHGANIVADAGRFYLFGELHSDTSNSFVGFSCYSSADLYNWRFERVALPLQKSGKLGPNRVGERPKVMKCPKTGEYIMYMHVDTLGYIDQFVGYATATSITGPYVFQGPLLFNGKPIKKWDMGAFQDYDGNGYILLHGGDIYQLNEDYRSITKQVNMAMDKGFESPAIFKKGNIYYFLGSNLSGWERNDNYYFTANSLGGPWTKRGLVAPEGTLTWNSQTSFVLPILGNRDTTFVFMGDRWSYPKQASSATYVWQPLTVDGYEIAMPKYKKAWSLDISTGITKEVHQSFDTTNAIDSRITYSNHWINDTLAIMSTDRKNASFSVKFTGKQVGIEGPGRPDGGYAHISITNSKGMSILSSNIDMYSKYTWSTLKFLSPVLPQDSYTLTVTVLGENWYWTEKSGRRTGSKGFYVSVDKLLVNGKVVSKPGESISVK